MYVLGKRDVSHVPNWPSKHLVVYIAIMSFYISIRCRWLGLLFTQRRSLLEFLKKGHNRQQCRILGEDELANIQRRDQDKPPMYQKSHPSFSMSFRENY